jgi:hypothetical protein
VIIVSSRGDLYGRAHSHCPPGRSVGSPTGAGARTDPCNGLSMHRRIRPRKRASHANSRCRQNQRFVIDSIASYIKRVLSLLTVVRVSGRGAIRNSSQRRRANATVSNARRRQIKKALSGWAPKKALANRRLRQRRWPSQPYTAVTVLAVVFHASVAVAVRSEDDVKSRRARPLVNAMEGRPRSFIDRNG